MKQQEIDRINELSRLSRERELTQEEQAERARLRRAYIDSVKAKLDLIEFCHRENIPIISSMGTGNRLNCTGFVIDKVEKTAGNGCGLSKVMRQELKKRGITGHTSLFNTRPPESKAVNSANGRNAPGSCPFAPNVAGLMVAQYVVSQLL